MPTPGAADPPWRVVVGTHIGASHLRKGQENQDDVGYLPADGAGVEVSVSVADGHGSATSFFSARGSRFAIAVAGELAAELLASRRADVPLPVLQRQLEEDGGKQLVREWRRRVEEDLVRDRGGFGGELERLREGAGDAAEQRVRDDPYLAYGSTLVGAVAADDFMAFWQLGDGDVVVVDEQGRASRPLPVDQRLIANETTSLCSPDAARQVRVGFSGTVAPFVLVSTDGLANSYADEEGFLRFGTDVFALARKRGLDAVHERLYDWLGRISAQGSGDDLTVGILFRTAAPAAAPPEPDEEAP